VFTSVTGLFTLSVSVAAPLAYEPPTTDTTAVFAVRETSWKSPFAVARGFADGKFDPLATDSADPLTEMTADVGGGDGGAGGTAGGVLEPEPEDPEPPLPVEPLPEPVPDDEVAGPPFANGSLLSKCENDSS
jgi:hypothetical protein